MTSRTNKTCLSLSLVSGTCHALFDRFLDEDFPDEFLPHPLDNDSHCEFVSRILMCWWFDTNWKSVFQLSPGLFLLLFLYSLHASTWIFLWLESMVKLRTWVVCRAGRGSKRLASVKDDYIGNYPWKTGFLRQNYPFWISSASITRAVTTLPC